MTFNFRIFKYKEGGYGIHETYYNDKGEVEGCAENAIMTGEDLEDLEGELENIINDFKKYKNNILNYE